MRIPLSLILLAAAGPAFAAAPQAVPKVSAETNATLARDLAASEAAGKLPADGAADLSASDPALAKLMDRIEGNVALPKGASALATYTRLYAWADQPRGKVTAIYLRRGTPPGRKWISFEELPEIDDGGCAVIELVYDVGQGRTDEIGCNSAA